MADQKGKTNKKSSNSKSNVTMKTVPNVRNFQPGKVYDKKVTKKDGKVVVTYQKLNQSGVIDRPSKVRKIYDNKGNLIKGNERVSGGYGSYTDIGIKGKKKVTTAQKETPNKAPVKKDTNTGKNVRSKEDAAKIKGIVEGMQRAPQKKKETNPKPVAPKMPTTIGSAKVSVPSKGKVKIEPNTGKPKSFTPPKTETKKVTPKVAPKTAAAPEQIKMETIPLATVAKQLQDSRPKAELEIPKSVTTAPKTTAPAEEKKGVFARIKERREARKAEREAEKRGSAGNALAMRKGGMVKKYQDGGSKRRPGSKMIQKKPVNIQQNPITEKNRLQANPSVAKKQIVTMKTRFVYPGKSGGPSPSKSGPRPTPVTKNAASYKKGGTIKKSKK